MYNTILVPLDKSKRAEKILPYVEELALCHLAKVIFLHIIEPPRFVGAKEGMQMAHEQNYEPQKREAENYFAELQEKFDGKGIETFTYLAHGPIVEEIIKVADKERSDIIAIASHGRGGVSRVFYGSVAAGLLQRIDRPLLLIRSREEKQI
jgi:nucleotide-binding universal stress UspA family protein